MAHVFVTHVFMPPHSRLTAACRRNPALKLNPLLGMQPLKLTPSSRHAAPELTPLSRHTAPEVDTLL